MTEFKKMLLRIARLPSSDQRWLLRQLTDEQRLALEQKKGLALLKTARRFRILKTSQLFLTPESPPALPAYCHQLADKAPLYSAVVLEQGSYPWQSLFLQQFDKDSLIQAALTNQVPDLKPLVKQALFNEWAKSVSFTAYLEYEHG